MNSYMIVKKSLFRGVVGVGSWEPKDSKRVVEGTPNESTKKSEAQILGTRRWKFLTTPLLFLPYYKETGSKDHLMRT